MNLSSSLNSHSDWHSDSASRKTAFGKSIVRVVDDDDSFRLSLHRLLRAEGFEVKAYGSVAEVLLDGARPRAASFWTWACRMPVVLSYRQRWPACRNHSP